MTRFLPGLIGLMLAAISLPAHAFGKQDIPEPLKPWVNWVLADEPQYSCPFFYQNYQQKLCRWPGPLRLTLTNKGGRFTSEWNLYQEDWVALPGDRNHWPQQVSSNRQAAVVIEHDGKPSLHLPAGHYQIDGEFKWDTLPENLALADETGLVHLRINDADINYPRIEQGSLWLNPEPTQPNNPQQDSQDLQVFRQIVDDVPLQVLTRLVVEVSGSAREIVLAHALLPQFIPVSLESPLPARIDPDGRLRLQVRPGRWSLDLLARYPQAASRLDLTIDDRTWPASELWSFQAIPALRLVEIENLDAIDGSQTNLPEEWRQLPTYQVKQGQSMVFKTIRRGDPEPEPNQLTLQRKLWLDFDGGGYTVRDTISGTMSRDWRLNAMAETQLGQVLLNEQNQLVTQLNGQGRGVELRRGTLQMLADSRIQADIGKLSAVGWQQSFQQVHAELNIPPGWRLLAVTGVDNNPSSWLTGWTLLDLFLVLIAALAVSRLWSWRWGVLTLLSLILIWHEADAPRWIWLNTLAALALLRVLPESRFSQWVQWYRNLCWLSLIAIVIPFMIAQIRIGLYPQLERPWQPIQPDAYPSSVAASPEQDLAAPTAALEMVKPAMPRAAKMRKNYVSPMEYGGSAAGFDRIDPDANLQTGPGLPQWQWQNVHLSWNGVVNPQQYIRLWYLSPPFSLLLHVLQALLAGVLALKLLDLINAPWRLNLPSLSVALLLPLLVSPVNDAAADMPDQAMLEQLKSRLLQAPPCLPACAELARMHINASSDDMRIELEFHAQHVVAVPLPAQLQQWYPQQVSLDGHEAQGLIRQGDDSLWLGLPAGVHKVVMQGKHNSHYKFTLPLPLPPQYSELKLEGWQVDGLYENGKVGPQLVFSRVSVGDANPAQAFQQTALPPFIEVERTIHFGLDWRLTTRIHHLSNNGSAVLLELPLLPGEAVSTANVRVKDGKVLVNMAAGQDSMEWQSLLEKREHLELKATETTQWRELWRADVSPIWHLQIEGLAVVHHQDQQGVWLPEWRPWPGESVRLTVSRPQAVAGPTLTIDKTQLRVKPGKRSELVEFEINLRSSKGGQHTITLPTGAELQKVDIDGTSQPIRQQGNTVTLPVRPGAQRIALNWLSTKEQSAAMVTPSVDLGIASVNSHIQVGVGEDRWVLFTFGPTFGPAALIWGLLIVLLLLASGLGQTNLAPLKHWQWFLLLVGISQIHIGAAMLVVGWLLALGCRARQVIRTAYFFNLGQIGLAVLTLCAFLLLFAAVQQGLLGAPDMQIGGNQSTAQTLNWYRDHSDPQLATATVVSAPMMLYRLLMLCWSLWMALSLLDWLRWGWTCFASNGLWRKTVTQTAKHSVTTKIETAPSNVESKLK